MKSGRRFKLVCYAALSAFFLGGADLAISGEALLAAATTAKTSKKTAAAKKKAATPVKATTTSPKTAAPKASTAAKPASGPAPKTAEAPKSTASATTGLTTADFNSGVKDAIAQAVKSAITSLGKENGYYLNQLVRIPMPAQLKPVDEILRNLGQTALSDRFIESMNRAAENAVPKTADIFYRAVSALTLEQAASLVKGPEDAATRFFEETTRQNLAVEIKPLVEESMKQAGVTALYSAMMAKAQGYMPFLSLMTPDLNQYVTDKALDGLFVVMAQEEKKIRLDPVARSTDILKKVFGKLFK